jgi:hypothetical protein
MSHIPLVEIRLREDECLPIEDMLYYAHLPNKERLHSERIMIEYYPEERRAVITAVEYREKKC